MKTVILPLWMLTSFSLVADDKPAPAPTQLLPIRQAIAAQPVPKSSPNEVKPQEARTIRLQFKFNGEEDGETHQIISTGGPFEINFHYSSADNESSRSIMGVLTTPGATEKIHFTFSIHQKHEDNKEGNRSDQTLRGSAALKAGKPTVLGTLGEQKLTVTATIEE